MKMLLALGFFALCARSGAAQTCPCPPDDLLAYECTNKVPVHDVLSDGTKLTSSQHAAGFSAMSGSTTIGTSTFSLVVSSSNTNTRFDTSDGGACIGFSASYVGFPTLVTVMDSTGSRALQLTKSNPLYCHTPTRDFVCFLVKGQAGQPFPTTLGCVPDRVSYACGLVS